MKTVLTTLFLLCLLETLSAETHRVFLGEVDLVGPVPLQWSADLTHLQLNPTDLMVKDPQGSSLGMIPGPFQSSLVRMLRNGLPIHLEVTHRYLLPRPHHHLRVSIWTDTTDLTLIEPLIYHIPIHTEEDLEDYE